MGLLDHDVEIDERAAAVFAAGMKAVALADDEEHPRELALIEQFRSELPTDVDPQGVVLTDDEVRDVFVSSLVFVGLADGELTEAEEATILELAQAHGVGQERVRSIVHEVRMAFIHSTYGTAS